MPTPTVPTLLAPPLRYATLKTASTGLVLGVAFLHLLDDADDALRQESEYPFASFGALIGVVLVTAMEQLVAISLVGAKSEGSVEVRPPPTRS